MPSPRQPPTPRPFLTSSCPAPPLPLLQVSQETQDGLLSADKDKFTQHLSRLQTEIDDGLTRLRQEAAEKGAMPGEIRTAELQSQVAKLQATVNELDAAEKTAQAAARRVQEELDRAQKDKVTLEAQVDRQNREVDSSRNECVN